MRDPAFGTAAFEFGAQIFVNNTHQENAGVPFDTGEDSINMMQTANKRPHMLSRPDIGKLGNTGASHLMHGLAGRDRIPDGDGEGCPSCPEK